jgi:aspartate/methionine/tyrosine aminotransferase
MAAPAPKAKGTDMKLNTRAMSSQYLVWAKLHSSARYNLATSGMMNFPLSALAVSIEDLEINGSGVYGYAPLQERLARKCDVATECIVAAFGTSMANLLALAAVITPGDDVLIERPGYGPIVEVASWLGANILRFDRRPENRFQIDPDELRRHLTAKTSLIVLSNLHNPSGAFTEEVTLVEIGNLAASIGAWVLVDEVYLDFVLEQTVRSSFHLGDHFIATNSLTKVYGLNGLRCGWILANSDLARRLWKLTDLFFNTPVHPGELLSVIALDHLELIGGRAKRLLHANHLALDAFLDGRSDLDVFRSKWGTVIFPKLRHGSVTEFCKLLRTKYETTVVPGQFFEMPEHFRVGIGGDPEMTTKALEQLSEALDEFGGQTHNR